LALLPASGASSLGSTAKAAADGAGLVLKETSGGALGPVYVFEENHALLRGQIQVAVMLTRLHKREGLRIIGLEGAFADGKPLPTRIFLPGEDALARHEALRRMLADGDLRATEYVGAVNPRVELWGLERREEYEVRAPSGVSPSLLAVIGIAEKTLDDQTLERVATLLKAQKGKEAIELLKSSDPWIREQLAPRDDDATDLGKQIRREQAILAKAREVGARLPQKVLDGMQKTIGFYRMAEVRSLTMASNMVRLAKAHRAGSGRYRRRTHSPGRW
jgi:hypothetical protein